MRFRLLALTVIVVAATQSAVSPQASAGTKAIGIDVSRFQGVIDWNAVAGSEFGSPSSRRAGAMGSTAR